MWAPPNTAFERSFKRCNKAAGPRMTPHLAKEVACTPPPGFQPCFKLATSKEACWRALSAHSSTLGGTQCSVVASSAQRWSSFPSAISSDTCFRVRDTRPFLCLSGLSQLQAQSAPSHTCCCAALCRVGRRRCILSQAALKNTTAGWLTKVGSRRNNLRTKASSYANLFYADTSLIA